MNVFRIIVAISLQIVNQLLICYGTAFEDGLHGDHCWQLVVLVVPIQVVKEIVGYARNPLADSQCVCGGYAFQEGGGRWATGHPQTCGGSAAARAVASVAT